MTKLSKTDEFLARLSIEMDHVKAGLSELKARGKKLQLEARLDFDKGLQAIERTQKDLKGRMAEWSKAGEKAGAEMKKGLERAAKDLRKAVDDAAARFK